MKILFIGKTMNYYIGDGINIRKSDNTSGKIEVEVENWKANQLMADFPDDFIPIPKFEIKSEPEKDIVELPKAKPQIKPKHKIRKKGGKK